MSPVIRDAMSGFVVCLAGFGGMAWLVYGFWIMAHDATEMQLFACMILSVATMTAGALVHAIQAVVWRWATGY